MNTKKADYDQEIEDRIEAQIVVDAYHEEKKAMSWYYYLQDNLEFPFKAKCIHERATSPLSLGETVNVIDMASEKDCLHDMLVKLNWKGKNLAVPLSQLETTNPDSKNEQPLNDWQWP